MGNEFYRLTYVPDKGEDGKWGIVDRNNTIAYEYIFDTEDEAGFVADYHNGHPNADYERDILPAWNLHKKFIAPADADAPAAPATDAGKLVDVVIRATDGQSVVLPHMTMDEHLEVSKLTHRIRATGGGSVWLGAFNIRREIIDAYVAAEGLAYNQDGNAVKPGKHFWWDGEQTATDAGVLTTDNLLRAGVEKADECLALQAEVATLKQQLAAAEGALESAVKGLKLIEHYRLPDVNQANYSNETRHILMVETEPYRTIARNALSDCANKAQQGGE